jgi:hypothetical protein
MSAPIGISSLLAIAIVRGLFARAEGLEGIGVMRAGG